MKILLLTLLSLLVFDINAQTTFDYHLNESPEGTYTMQLISTSDNNTDVIVEDNGTSLYLKIPSGETVTPSGNWNIELSASAATINSNCGYTPSWNLYRVYPTSNFTPGAMPNGTVYDLTTFTFTPSLGDVYAFEDNETAEPCVSGGLDGGPFDNALQVDIDGGSASYAGQSLPGSTTLYTTQPITLLNFTAKRYNSTSSYLSWTSENEINFDKFELERSIDTEKWEFISSVKGLNLERNTHKYSYIDKDVYDGLGEEIYYYRLKILDLDGRYTYSNIRNVTFDSKDRLAELILFPNPSIEKVYYTLQGMDKGTELSLKIYNNIGALISTKSAIYDTKVNLLLDNSRFNFKNGVYNVIITDKKGNKYFKKLVLTK